MNFGTGRLLGILLATTSLTTIAASAASADVLYASSLEGFSQNPGQPTLLTPNDTTVVNDLGLSTSEGGQIVDYFEVTGYDNAQPFDITLSTPYINSQVTEGGTTYSPATTLEGTSFGDTQIERPRIFAGPGLEGASEGFSIFSTGFAGASASSEYYPEAAAPVLTFYDDSEDVLYRVLGLEGNSFSLEGIGLPDDEIFFSVAFDFDYVVTLDVPAENAPAVPEPGSAALLGAGLAGLAAARALTRKKTPSSS
jgi:hypothetical protein